MTEKEWACIGCYDKEEGACMNKKGVKVTVPFPFLGRHR